MKAIVVKFYGPTNTKGSRLVAQAEGVKPVTVPLDYGLGVNKTALWAAAKLCINNGWTGTLVDGMLPNGDRVFCFAGGGETFFGVTADMTTKNIKEFIK